MYRFRYELTPPIWKRCGVFLECYLNWRLYTELNFNNHQCFSMNICKINHTLWQIILILCIHLVFWVSCTMVHVCIYAHLWYQTMLLVHTHGTIIWLSMLSTLILSPSIKASKNKKQQTKQFGVKQKQPVTKT